MLYKVLMLYNFKPGDTGLHPVFQHTMLQFQALNGGDHIPVNYALHWTKH